MAATTLFFISRLMYRRVLGIIWEGFPPGDLTGWGGERVPLGTPWSGWRARLLGRGKERTGPCCPSIAEDMNLVNFGLDSLPVIKQAASKLQHTTQPCAHQSFCGPLPSPGWHLLRHFCGLPVPRYYRYHHQLTRLTVFTPAETQAYLYIQHSLSSFNMWLEIKSLFLQPSLQEI